MIGNFHFDDFYWKKSAKNINNLSSIAVLNRIVDLMNRRFNESLNHDRIDLQL